MYEPETIAERIRLGSYTPERLRQAAFRVITRTQDDPQYQIQGAALALVAMCRAINVDVRQLLAAAERRLADVDSPFAAQMKAIEAYTQHEIRRG